VVIGAGVAGLRAAIELARTGSVLVMAKDTLHESSSEYAQGGIACALGADDDVSLHEADTLSAGDGLSDPAAVRTLVSEGPAAVRELIDWGARFDRVGGHLQFAREGAHSRSRVLHAQGDSTGREIAHSLYRVAAGFKNITFRGFSAVVDLLVEEGRVVGALALDEASGELLPVYGRAVLLATGGLGQVFADTTNPEVATGDGVAMAWRAGARVCDIEFVQFHPTALHLAGAPRFLLSEALRGEGAQLKDIHGERFMVGRHPLAELAPRDVVAAEIFERIRATGAGHVLLDLSWRGEGFVQKRFPRIHATCLKHGIDLDLQPAPVCPAAHYAMGGVGTDLDGRTSLAGLWAAGEAASTGVHGANRLASNSLLEGVVFGLRAARSMSGAAAPQPAATCHWSGLEVPELEAPALRELATAGCGILRDEAGLRATLETLAGLAKGTPERLTRALVERANIATVLDLIARAALARHESRGAHRRVDYPEKVDALRQHSVLVRSSSFA
jgi:L-aspartate oxidase